MNTVWNSYGQLYGCPEILKKVINFFVAGLTYGCLKSCTRIRFTPDIFEPLFIS
ncbi:hypothetical protein K040078D81_42080 [Blautia hominis]|uniref:Uncharacterized protein n=1 Tax=Blautia hominis TaxID=2025493 RepID=A0ABQ0BF89_9FIRM